MKVAKIDIDCTLLDMTSKLVELYNKKFDTNITTSDIHYYDVEDSFPLLNGNAYKYFFEENEEEVFIKSKMFDGVKDGIDILKEKGYHIMICSYRFSLNSKRNALTWLHENDIQYDSISFTHDKHLIDCDIFFDDKPFHLQEENIYNPKCITVCIDAAYNKEWKGLRCKSFYEGVLKYS